MYLFARAAVRLSATAAPPRWSCYRLTYSASFVGPDTAMNRSSFAGGVSSVLLVASLVSAQPEPRHVLVLNGYGPGVAFTAEL